MAKLIYVNIDWLFVLLGLTSWCYYLILYIVPILFISCVKGDINKKTGDDKGNHDQSRPIYISFMIPCHNEELVIQSTLENLKKISYNLNMIEVLVINDGSTDGTENKIKSFIDLESNEMKTHILSVDVSIAKQGKSVALNRGFEFLEMHTQFKKDLDHIVCILDADGKIGLDVLEYASDKFQNNKLGALNSSIRIRNRNHILTLMQDMEFLIAARYLNYARGIVLHNSFMGGNGQFMRYPILEELKKNDGHIWERDAMTEDLEIGLRILRMGWECKQMLHGFIHQQGLKDFVRLYRQRIRWGWGTIQVLFWEVYSGKIFFNNKMSYLTRFDVFMMMNNNMIYFLLFPLTISLTLLYVFDIIHMVFIVHPWVLWVNGAMWTGYLIIGTCFVDEYRNWKIVPYLLSYIMYVMLMATTIVVAVKKFLICEKAAWAKTDEEEDSEGDDENSIGSDKSALSHNGELEIITDNIVL